MQQSLNKQLISERFNRAAPNYDQVAVVQREVGKSLEERLADINLIPERIIDLGCGTGKNLTKLSQRYPHAQIYGVDFSTSMVLHSRQKTALNHVAADAAHLPFADNSIDLIFSNLMLQWCDPLLPTLQECYRVLREGGLLLFSTFGPDTLYELRYCWAQIDSYAHINDFLDMHNIGDMLMKLNFNDPVMDMEYITTPYTNMQQILYDLKKLGSINSHQERRKTLTGKNRLQQLAQHYQQFSLADKRLPVTYEIVYGHAWKFKRVENVASTETYIPIDAIKR